MSWLQIWLCPTGGNRMQPLRALLPLAILSLTGASADAQASSRLTLGADPAAACVALAGHKIPVTSFGIPSGAGTMDSAGRAARIEMAKKGELIAAYRLPSGAFEKYAGTSVVTDIIVKGPPWNTRVCSRGSDRLELCRNRAPVQHGDRREQRP